MTSIHHYKAFSIQCHPIWRTPPCSWLPFPSCHHLSSGPRAHCPLIRYARSAVATDDPGKTSLCPREGRVTLQKPKTNCTAPLQSTFAGKIKKFPLKNWTTLLHYIVKLLLQGVPKKWLSECCWSPKILTKIECCGAKFSPKNFHSLKNAWTARTCPCYFSGWLSWYFANVCANPIFLHFAVEIGIFDEKSFML